MPKCQNCGRWVSIKDVTNDLICPNCNHFIAFGDEKRLVKQHKKLLGRVDNAIQRLDQIGREPRESPRIEREVLKIGILGIIYLSILAYLEFVTYYIASSIAVLFSFITILILIFNASIIPIKTHQNFLIALGLFPLIRIVSLTIPVAEIPQIYWYFIMAIPILVGIIGIIKYFNYSFNDIGLNLRKPFIQLLIALVGIGLGVVDYIILRPESLIDTLNVQTVIIPAFILIIATGFTEEMVFRGVLQRASCVLGSWGWVYVAIVYTITQIGHNSLYHIIYAFLVSILFGWMVKKSGSILGTSISHGLLNVGLYLVVPHIGIQLVFPEIF